MIFNYQGTRNAFFASPTKYQKSVSTIKFRYFEAVRLTAFLIVFYLLKDE